jgi:hypothetical protein
MMLLILEPSGTGGPCAYFTGLGIGTHPVCHAAAPHGVLHFSSSNTASTVPLRTARASASWSFSF